jgi:hypothetical protein
MKAPKLTALLTFLTISSSSIGIDNALAAATFDEHQIDQNQIIAIARPYGRGKYDLLVIEQIPGKKQCWSESDSNPTIVDPLLLKFDFTGHCSRSTDSNGYSMRIEGRDLGLNYLLRVVEGNGELLLVGTSRTSPNQPDIVLGRTYGMKPGFMKFQLNPGWKFSKRSYQGKVLGHVYFSGDRTALDAANSSTTVAALPSNRDSETGFSDSTPAVSNPTENPKTDTSSIPSNAQSANSAQRELTFTAQDPNNAPASSNSRRLPSVLSSPGSPLPSSSRSSVPLPRSLSSSPSSPSPSSPPSVRPSNSLPLPPSIASGQTQDNTAATPTPSTAPNSDALSPLPPPPQASNSQVVPPPTGRPRGSLSEVMAVSPRPLPGGSNADVASSSVPTSNNYRVLVQASGSQQEQLRSRFPEAFRTFYQGQTMWQVGRFTSRENVDKTLQDLQTMGLEGIVLE